MLFRDSKLYTRDVSRSGEYVVIGKMKDGLNAVTQRNKSLSVAGISIPIVIHPRHQTISKFFFFLLLQDGGKHPARKSITRDSADEKERKKETGHRKSISNLATERNVGELFRRH